MGGSDRIRSHSEQCCLALALSCPTTSLCAVRAGVSRVLMIVSPLSLLCLALFPQKMMVMLLRKLGYEILVAANGREALTLLEEQARRGKEWEINCILMDASMDVMDGMECTRVIRAQQLPHRVRPVIIAQTANVTEEYRVKCLQSGM